jgi:hypothetical protein
MIAEKLVSVTEQMAQVGREATKAGMAVDAFSALSYAAKMADVSTESLAAGLKFMNKNIAEAEAGSQKAAAAFAHAGVSIAAIKDLNPDQQFLVIAEAIKRLESPAERTRVSLELFGRAGNQLAPLFEEGALGIQKLEEAAKALGKTLDTEQTKRATEAADAIKKLTAAWEALEQHFVSKTGGAISGAADFIRKLFGGSTEMEKLRERKAELEQMLQFNPQGGGEVRSSMLDEIKLIDTAIAKLTGDSKQAADALAKTVKSALTTPDPTAGSDRKKKSPFDDIRLGDIKIPTSHIDEFYQHLDSATQTGIEKALSEWAKFQAELAALLNDKKISPEEYAKRWESEMNKVLAPIEVHAKMLRKTVTDDLSDVEKAGKQLSQDLEDDFARVFDGSTKNARQFFDMFLKQIDQVVAKLAASSLMTGIFGSDKGAGLFTSGLSLLGFAGGGDPPVGQASLVGERGPELFIPKVPGTIVPNGAMGAMGSGVTINHAPIFNIDSRSDRSQIMSDINSATQQNNASLVQMLTRYNPGLRV